MIHWKFYGTADHSPMWWAVGEHNDKFAVIESYDEGESWICNCILDTEQAGWDFIAAWFCQFYEGDSA